ncbi:MAG: dodecin family protein [Thermoguttaceae bacterium]|nr:dodecin family protein [Thermoguttaceae bacterium]MDW8039253.1 dodecin domain-containing protein [Thermoguttaceae bacterium]
MESPIYKKFEIVGTSPLSLSEAILNAVQKAVQVEPGVSWFEVAEIRGRVQNGNIDQFQVTVRIGAKIQ